MAFSITYNKQHWAAYGGAIGASSPPTVPSSGYLVCYLSSDEGYSFDSASAFTVTKNGSAIAGATGTLTHGRLKVTIPVDNDGSYVVTATPVKQADVYTVFFACSDIHNRTIANQTPTLNFQKVQAEYTAGMVCCAGDLTPNYNLTAADVVYQLFKNSDKNGTCTGNHEGGNGTANITEDEWKATVGGDGWINIKEVCGTVYFYLSLSKAGGFSANATLVPKAFPVFTPETCSRTLELLDEYQAAGKRVILFTHYPCENISNPTGNLGNGFKLNSTDPFGARIGIVGNSTAKPLQASTRGYIMPYYTQNAAVEEANRQNTYAFLQAVASYPNVLYFSGHAHTRWEYQYGGYDDGVNYDGAGNPPTYPHIKAMRYNNTGAAMINLPSLGWNGQDAIVEVTAKRITIKGRSDRAILPDIHYYWDKKTDGTYTFATEATDPDPEPAVYSITVMATGCTVSGASTITEGKTATLKVTATDGYTLPESVAVTGASHTWDKATGTLVLSSPTEAVQVTVTAAKLPSVYNITVEASGCTFSGDTTIIENSTATITLSPFTDYTLPATISVTNATYTWDANSGVITLSNPTGPVTISASAIKIPTTYSISINAHNCTVTGATTIKEGSTATLIATAHEDYILPSDVSVVGAQYTWNASTGTLVLSNPTSNVSITITAIEVVTDNYTITYHLTHCSSTTQPATIGRKQSVVLTLVANDGYALPATITSYNASSTWNKTTGQLVLYNAVGNVIITAIGTALPSNATNIPIYTKELVQILTRSEVWRLDGMAQPTRMYTKKLVEIIFNNESYSNFITTTGTFITKDGDIFRVVEVDADTPVNAAKSLDGYALMSSDGQYLLIKEDGNV
jgi:hypothetical protein